MYQPGNRVSNSSLKGNIYNNGDATTTDWVQNLELREGTTLKEYFLTKYQEHFSLKIDRRNYLHVNQQVTSFIQVVYKSYREVIRVLFIITSSKTSLPLRSTTRRLIPVKLFMWRFPRVEFRFIIHSLCMVLPPTNQIDRSVTLRYLSPPQMRGLSSVLWARRNNSGAQ